MVWLGFRPKSGNDDAIVIDINGRASYSRQGSTVGTNTDTADNVYW